MGLNTLKPRGAAPTPVLVHVLVGRRDDGLKPRDSVIPRLFGRLTPKIPCVKTDASGAHQDVARTRIRLEQAFSAKSSGAHKPPFYLFYREGQTIRFRAVGQFEF